MMGANGKLSSIFFSYALLLLCYANARDTLTDGNSIRDDGSEGLVSAGGEFELGFFTPTPTTTNRRRYVGIWYHNLSPTTYVWVANRENPLLFNSTGILAIHQGNLLVLDNVTGKSSWSTELDQTSSSLKTVKLMDSGNLVLTDDNDEGVILWQSFRSPTDTFIPGMVMDKSVELTSWREKDDPGIGNFLFKLDQEGDNQVIIWKKSIPYWKDGVPGEFMSSTEMPSLITHLLSNFSKSTRDRPPISPGKVGFNPYINHTTRKGWDYNYTRLVMHYTGELRVWKWLEHEKQWVYYWSEPRDRCSVFNACGSFGSCNRNNEPLVCNCLPGFKPLYVEKWDSGDFSTGCVRKLPTCDKDIFLSLKMMKVGKPDPPITVNNETECRNECLKALNNCCQAYSYAAAENRTRRDGVAKTPLCWIWWTELNNLEEEYGEGGHNLSIRVASSDLESTVRTCEPCGTTMIPYPLSTRLDCGDPMYFRFNCDASTGQVSFVGLNETYRVIGISPSTQRFVIQAKNVDNCDPTNRGTIQQLNPSLPYKVINWCKGEFSFDHVSSGGSNVVEMGWEPPLEPMCTKSTDCRDWPHSTCNPARDRKKRCLCNTNFKWNGTNLNCTLEGNIQESLKPPLEEHLSLIVVAVVISVFFLTCIFAIYIWRRKMTKKRDQISRGRFDSERRVKELIDTNEFKEEDEKGIDVPFFDLQSIQDATDNFSDANKLGQGGYGPVYKGKFLGGQEIAVKRLSRVSGQGLQEFKNEVVLIAKLQHRNLVRLRGYCMKGEEKILLYEYMPNKSLDSFIFDHTQSVFLNWEMRFNIILGIARGLLYLHQDSRLRIIHRDLKTSNILLDEEMNPKISDFGLARIVGGKETESNTNTVVGTYGYMSPEYALDGTFSVKSDVFSFGVVLLEIISGKKNTAFYQSKQTFSLLSHTWRLWTENKVLDLMDMTLHESCHKSQFIKCVNVGLLCVQEDPSDRPTMSNVITMLDSETAIPPAPKEPAFAIRRGNSSTAFSSSKPSETHAEITVTLEEGR